MEEIERRAQAVLADVPDYVWDGESLPVPVDDIVSTCFTLRVCEVEDLTTAPGAPSLADDQTLSGLLLARTREIWVNAEEAEQWPRRRRFTIGHELGHWVLHRTDHDSVFCRHANVDPPEGEDVPDIEEEASRFAAGILMPARLLEHHYRNTTRDFNELCDMFDASMASMGRRLHQVI